MASLKPPQAPPLWNHSAESIVALTKEAIANERTRQNQIGGLVPGDCNFKSVRALETTLVHLTTSHHMHVRFL